MKATLTRKSLQATLLIYLITASGCSLYQYVSIDSNVQRNDREEFVIENDTARLTYTFAGQNFPVTIQIFNKLLQPIYVDLGRSTIIINNFQVNGSFYGSQTDFVAPRSYATISSIPLREEFINLRTQDSLKNFVKVGGLGKVYSFNEANTPIYFRSIIALTPNEDYSYPTFFDYSFWVSEVVQSQMNPASIKYKQPNQFYFQKTTGFGKTMAWTSMSVFLVFLSATNTEE